MPVSAFVGAEGFGSDTTHGRGGEVLFIDNLNEDGPGSARAAFEASGPRIIIPRVDGDITHVAKALTVKNDQWALFGQCAPGDGICFVGQEIRWQSAHGVMQFVRIRTGDIVPPKTGEDFGNRDCMNSGSPADQTNPPSTHHLVFDHLSMSKATDETCTWWYATQYITLQWSLAYKGFRFGKHPKTLGTPFKPHSMGILNGIRTQYATYHHNGIFDCLQRNQQVAGDDTGISTIDISCGTVFNWVQEPLSFEHLGNKANVRHMYYKIGPDHDPASPLACIRAASDALDLKLYVEDLIDPTNPKGALDPWQSVRLDNGQMPDQTAHRLSAPLPCAPVTMQDAATAHKLVVRNAGCRLPQRDDADLEVLEEVRRSCYKKGESFIVDTADPDFAAANGLVYDGGWPVLRGGAPKLDSNDDGVPDYYAAAAGFDVMTDIASMTSPSGRTYIEDWAASLAIIP